MDRAEFEKRAADLVGPEGPLAVVRKVAAAAGDSAGPSPSNDL